LFEKITQEIIKKKIENEKKNKIKKKGKVFIGKKFLFQKFKNKSMF